MSDPEVRTGCKVIHTLRAGASIRMLAPQHHPRIAIITRPDGPPYFLHEDGTLEEITVD